MEIPLSPNRLCDSSILLSMMVPSQHGDLQNDLLSRQPQARCVQQYRHNKEEETEEIERSILVDIQSIRSEVHPLCVNNRPLSSRNENLIPGELSYSQARELEQTMASPNPGQVDLRHARTLRCTIWEKG